MPRGVGPSRIATWAATAQRLAADDSTCDLSLIVAYSTWEALRTRTLAVALNRQGYSMKVAHEFLGSGELNDRIPVKNLAPIILGRDPHQLPGAGKNWRNLDKWERHRNGLVHGLSTYSPTRLREGTLQITTLIINPAWLDTIEVPVTLGVVAAETIPLGQVLASQRSKVRCDQSAENLANTIRGLRKKGR